MQVASKFPLSLFGLLAIALILLPKTVLSQGSFERSSPETRVLFEDGNYFETYWLAVSPDLNGAGGLLDPAGLGTGDIFESFDVWAFSLKTDLTCCTSLALILDQPWGADTNFPLIATSGYSGTFNRLESNQLSGILKQKIGNNFSAYGGLRIQSLKASAGFPFGGLLGLGGPYSAELERDEGVGFLAGAAYEIPEIKFRFAATYYSEVETSHDTVELAGASAFNTETVVSTPQSINLELQSGIANNTIAFGSVRWVDWSKFTISPPLFEGVVGLPAVEYSEDFFTYTAGIGRKITERFDLSFLVRYTPMTNQELPTVGPFDGNISYIFAPSLQLPRVKVTTIIGYTDLGAGTNFAGTQFDDGEVVTVGLQLGFHF